MEIRRWVIDRIPITRVKSTEVKCVGGEQGFHRFHCLRNKDDSILIRLSFLCFFMLIIYGSRLSPDSLVNYFSFDFVTIALVRLASRVIEPITASITPAAFNKVCITVLVSFTDKDAVLSLRARGLPTLGLTSLLPVIMVTGLSDRCSLMVQLSSEPLPIFTVPLFPVLAAVLSVVCAVTLF